MQNCQLVSFFFIVCVYIYNDGILCFSLLGINSPPLVINNPLAGIKGRSMKEHSPHQLETMTPFDIQAPLPATRLHSVC